MYDARFAACQVDRGRWATLEGHAEVLTDKATVEIDMEQSDYVLDTIEQRSERLSALRREHRIA